jgi:hypothetical protein
VSEAERIQRERENSLKDFAFVNQTLDAWGCTPREKASALGTQIASDSEWSTAQWRLTQLPMSSKVKRSMELLIETKAQLDHFLSAEEQRDWLSHKDSWLDGKSPHEAITEGLPGIAKVCAIVQALMGDIKVSSEDAVAKQQIDARAAMMADIKTVSNAWMI